MGDREWPGTAEALMRSRFEAFRNADVEFRASYLAAPGEVRVMHERSRFVRDDGRWYYLDAETNTRI